MYVSRDRNNEGMPLANKSMKADVTNVLNVVRYRKAV